jgi:hypothetical protein
VRNEYESGGGGLAGWLAGCNASGLSDEAKQQKASTAKHQNKTLF